MEPSELGEVLKVVISLYARQLAMQDLLRRSGVTQTQMDEALRDSKTRLAKVPKLAHLANPRPSDLQGLSELLESIQWPFEM